MKPPKITKEMLAKGYQSPKEEKGIRIEGEGGHLTTSPAFTTSASAQEANADKRSTQGAYFGDRVEVISDPTVIPEVDTGRPLQPYPTTLNVCRQYGLMSDRQKELHNQGLKDNAPQVFSLTERQRKQIHKRR